MLLGVTQHPAGRGDVKNNLLPAASSAARHAQAARLAHLETFVKAHLLSDNVTDTQGCRRLSLLAGLEDSGPVSLAEIIIKKKMWKLRAITSVFNVSKKQMKLDYLLWVRCPERSHHIPHPCCKHCLSRLALFSPQEMKGIEGRNASESTKKKLHLCSPFFVCPSASNGAFKVKYYLLII